MAQNSLPGMPRVLVSAKLFCEGFGGTPESILLVARHLATVGLACDVLSSKGLVVDAHLLAALPAADSRTAFRPASALDIAAYASLFIAGPWNFQAIALSGRARRAGLPVTYAAKGGLCWSDFARLRDLKKIPYLLLLELLLILRARSILFTSSIERDAFVVPKIFWKNKYAIVPEPFEPLSLPPLGENARPHNTVLGFMAEISPRKGLRELVEGFALLLARRQSGPLLLLRVVGVPRPGSEPYLNQIKSFAERAGIAAQIEWVGALRGVAERRAFYESVDIFLCPSQFESFGLTPLEALWHGTPVAMGPQIGARAFIPDEAPIAVFKDLSAGEIANTLEGQLAALAPLAESARAWRGRRLPQLSGEALARRFQVIFMAGARGGAPALDNV